jgi:hypothetical protein
MVENFAMFCFMNSSNEISQCINVLVHCVLYSFSKNYGMRMTQRHDKPLFVEKWETQCGKFWEIKRNTALHVKGTVS